ncbi:MAG: hypothetical protein CVT63_05950 [Candidatus Anoxymicrobium japonicum]|uniref:Uncharacterized protein n=1 Tax=Candidatus Anoxymicrobium japonicum TaxID=2013648 RepID=A0A2N3G527_9ACTN|nr:MAG: hypothetical protein CVT63_05950 [Candidatus Anoxymicrobium japonicum]
MAVVPGSWCPIRQPQVPGAKALCEDSCALYISSSKLPSTHSCAVTALGIYALQRIVVPGQLATEKTNKPAEQPQQTRKK